MNKFEFDDFEFRHGKWFAVLVIILFGLFAQNNLIINNSITNLICFFFNSNNWSFSWISG